MVAAGAFAARDPALGMDGKRLRWDRGVLLGVLIKPDDTDESVDTIGRFETAKEEHMA